MALALVSVPAFGQITTGSVNGVINDPGGATVAGANVTLRNSETGAERTTTTNEQGEFDFQQVSPGKYSVSVEAKGFKKSTLIVRLIREHLDRERFESQSDTLKQSKRVELKP